MSIVKIPTMARLSLFIVSWCSAIATHAQTTDGKMCGAECVYVAISVLKPESAPDSYRSFCDGIPKVQENGYSLATLRELAEQWGLHAELMRMSVDDLDWYCERNLMILRTSNRGTHHFVLCEQSVENGFQVLDNRRRRSISRAALDSRWDGESLVLSSSPIVHRKESRWRTVIVAACVFFACATVFFVFKAKRGTSAMVLGVLIALSGCDGNQIASKGKAGPTQTLVAIGPTSVDLGVVELDTATYTASFELRNESRSPINIDDMRTSCSCALVTASSSQIEPGETCTINLLVEPGKSSARNAFVKVIAGSVELKLTAHWQLGDPFQPVESEFPILNVNVGQSGRQTVRLLGDGGDAIVQSITIPSIDGFEHRAEVTAETCVLEVSVNDTVAPGIYYGCVTLASPAYSDIPLQLPWTVRVTAPLTIFPRQLYFALDEERSDNPLTRSIQVIVESVEAGKLSELSIDSVPADVAGFTANLELIDENSGVVDLHVNDSDWAKLEAVSFRIGSDYSTELKINK